MLGRKLQPEGLKVSLDPNNRWSASLTDTVMTARPGIVSVPLIMRTKIAQ